MKANLSKILFILFTSILSGCSQFLEVPPPTTELVTGTVFENNSTANAAVLGIYSRMINQGRFPRNISHYVGLSSDELQNYSTYPDIEMFYRNDLNSLNSYVISSIWTPAYSYIFQANEIIDGLAANSSGVLEQVKRQIQGEALFIRAFLHFYLVNLYGEIPLVTSTDYQVNSTISRSSTEVVYKQIIDDLMASEQLMNQDYVDADGISVSSERVRPNRAAAQSLLARTYLYLGDYVNAEAYANKVIDNSLYGLVTDLDDVFLKNSQEAIWQLQPDFMQTNTPEALAFKLTGPPSTLIDKSATVSGLLMEAFESGDQRREHWIGSITVNDKAYSFPSKYKLDTPSPSEEYSMVLRLAELYFIRAEARAYQDNIDGALADINTIRMRADLSPIEYNSRESTLRAIMLERSTELFSEWGHRWLDIKRTKNVDEVMAEVTSMKGGTWNSTSQLYPIPQVERDNNPNLSQNNGY